jgi:hypothetical protein
MSINALIRCCINFEEGYYKNLQHDFQNDMLLAYMGVKTDKEISSKNIDAYFLEDFFGVSVPVGFMKYIGMDDPICSKSSDIVEMRKNSFPIHASICSETQTKGYSIEVYKTLADYNETINAMQRIAGLDAVSASSALSKLPCIIRTNLTRYEADNMIKALVDENIIAIKR